MKFGRDKYDERTSADNAVKGNEYFCPCCNAPLILKQGQIRDWHFAHEKDSECDAFTESKMTEWHINHQNDFPPCCQEVRMEANGVVHIADVFCNGVIWEFQHSPMSNDVFEERCKFYSQKGTLIWVFDMRDQWKGDRISWVQKAVGKDYGYFKWNNANKMLGQYDFSNGLIHLFLELDDTGWGCLVTWNPDGMKYFGGKRMSKKQLLEHMEKIAASAEDVQIDPSNVLCENRAIVEAKKEAAARLEAANRLLEEDKMREAKRKEAQSKLDIINPEILRLEAEADWANRTYVSIQKELSEKKAERDTYRKVLGWWSEWT